MNAGGASDEPFSEVRALAFDVIGTVVDWRTTLVREGEALGNRMGIGVDWARFADAWRAMERPLQEQVRRGEIPWMNRDGLHRMALDSLLAHFGVGQILEDEKAELCRAWDRLEPWPDAVPGLTRLRRRFIVAPLSNASFACLTNMARRRRIPWDCILSADMIRSFKPDPRVYLMAAEYLDLRPEQIMMVASHVYDLLAAAEVGLRTAFVPRPLEWGPEGVAEDPGGSQFDIVASDFLDLAEQMGT